MLFIEKRQKRKRFLERKKERKKERKILNYETIEELQHV